MQENTGMNDNVHAALIVSQIPLPHREYIEIMGLDSFCGLCRKFGGKNIYLPAYQSLQKQIVRPRIIAEYKKGNVSMESLALEYDMSPKTIAKYIHESE